METLGDRLPGIPMPTGEIGTFPTTCWTVVRQAAANGTVANSALDSICRQYWYPLYAFARHKGHQPHDAQDLTQGFFESLLGSEGLARVDPHRGRLRSFLLGAMKRFMAREWRRNSAAKRGGGKSTVTINTEAAEEHLRTCLSDDAPLSPDRFFDRCWAHGILDRTRKRLECEYRDKGSGEQFRTLSQYLAWNGGGQAYHEAARKLDLKEGAVKVAVHRMRKRFGQLLRDEIADTVSAPEQIDDELKTLVAVLREP